MKISYYYPDAEAGYPKFYSPWTMMRAYLSVRDRNQFGLIGFGSSTSYMLFQYTPYINEDMGAVPLGSKLLDILNFPAVL